MRGGIWPALGIDGSEHTISGNQPRSCPFIPIHGMYALVLIVLLLHRFVAAAMAMAEANKTGEQPPVTPRPAKFATTPVSPSAVRILIFQMGAKDSTDRYVSDSLTPSLRHTVPTIIRNNLLL